MTPDADNIIIWRKALNSFCIIDYVVNSETQTAIGKLESVSDSGKILVRHLKNDKKFWIFDIHSVKNSKFEPIKEKRDNSEE
tara:strand:+ start:2964 stop:3209 length:246 start_codon:yes stop_codon:yes gene_type:complete